MPGPEKDKLALIREYLDNDIRQIEEMADLFLTTLPKDLRQLTLLCDKEDLINIEKTAHRIKSSVRLFGMEQPGHLFHSIEVKSKEGAPISELAPLIKKAVRMMDKELLWLRRQKDNLSD
jgi:HPt (histidine-containing phosphotransfer) domain-containing protein